MGVSAGASPAPQPAFPPPGRTGDASRAGRPLRPPRSAFCPPAALAPTSDTSRAGPGTTESQFRNSPGPAGLRSPGGRRVSRKAALGTLLDLHPFAIFPSSQTSFYLLIFLQVGACTVRGRWFPLFSLGLKVETSELGKQRICTHAYTQTPESLRCSHQPTHTGLWKRVTDTQFL